MFGSEALEVGLGLTFIYLVLSLACTAFTEVFAAAVRLRAGVLRDGIYNLLSEDRYGFRKKVFGRFKGLNRLFKQEANALANQFYDHPLIRSLYESGHGPSYVPARTFALVLQDLLGLTENQVKSAADLTNHLNQLKGGTAPAPKNAPAPKSAPPQGQPTSQDTQRIAEVLAMLAEEARQDKVLAREGSVLDQARLMAEMVKAGISQQDAKSFLEDAQQRIGTVEVEVAQLREKIEVWYNNAMDRVSGWYKRWTKALSFITALAIVIAINADTIEITAALTSNDALREALVNQADTYAQVSATAPDSLLAALIAQRDAAPDTSGTAAQLNQATLDDVIAQARAANMRLDTTMTQLVELGLPLGWPSGGICNWVSIFCEQDATVPFFPKLFGLLLTAFALTLGAPFWFDVLNKIVAIRSSGKSTEEKPKSPKAKPKRPEEVAPQ